MKVLILPTETGQGHNSASLAIKEYLDGRGIETIILDVLNAGKKNKSKAISGLYDFMVNRLPGVFGALYHIGELISSDKRHSPIYWINSFYASSLNKKIALLRPDVIVCPHIFSAQAVTRLIEKYGLRIHTVGVMTDYTCSPFWEETKLDFYTAANAEIADECAAKGMDRKKILPIGIPVSAKFERKIPKQEARAAFGVAEDKVFAIMGGSMGYGKIPEIAGELVRLTSGARVLAVCGSNDGAYERAGRIPGVTALRSIDNIDALMDAADVLLTKPGGLSVTEAMTKRVPTIITMPIPGGETRNSEFIVRMGMALESGTAASAARAARALLSDGEARARMAEAQDRYCAAGSAAKIGELIINLAEGAEVCSPVYA